MPGRGKGLKQIFLGFSSVFCVCAMDTNWTLNIPRTLEKTSCAKVIITSDIAGEQVHTSSYQQDNGNCPLSMILKSRLVFQDFYNNTNRTVKYYGKLTSISTRLMPTYIIEGKTTLHFIFRG